MVDTNATFATMIFGLVSVLFALVTLILTGAEALRFLAVNRAKQAALTKANNEPATSLRVTVIIAAHNAAHSLSQNLPSILNQAYADFCVVVVNNGSNDNSAEVLANFQEKYPDKVKVIHLAEANKKKALNAAIEAAPYAHLVFTDADCAPASEQWLGHMANILENSQLALGYGPLQGSGFTGALSRWETWQTATLYFQAALRQKPYMGVGRNMGYAKSVYSQAQGFKGHKNLLGGDDDLMVQAASKLKVSTGLAWAQESFCYSAAPKNLGDWYQQKRRHFSTAGQYAASHKFYLAAYASLQIAFYLLFALGLILTPAVVLIIFLFRYLTQLSLAWPLAQHFKLGTHLVFFPIYEAVWVTLSVFIQVQNFIMGKPKGW